MEKEHLRTFVRDVPDHPIPGIMFRDIGPLLATPHAFKRVTQLQADKYRDSVDAIAALDARGFLFGAPLAQALDVPFVMIRKAGKLPGETHKVGSVLEYGTADLEISMDSFAPGSRVLLVDDVLATGGTAVAAAKLIEHAGGQVVRCAFVIELKYLPGGELLERHQIPFDSLIAYDE
jgi:adenine phosphoribosyltransferase